MTQPIHARFQLTYGEFNLVADLTLPGTGISVIFGHSGCGKTTLLRCIAGLQRAPQGWLQINGQIWQDSEQGIFLPTYQRPLGYVFQEASLFPHLTVAQNLQFGLQRLGKTPQQVDLPAILALLGIEHLLTRRPAHLSGGERQRVAIARALSLQPQILLMDEPLAALDLKRKQELLPYFTRLHQVLEIPVLYVTHSQQEVAQLADYLVLMEAGHVVAAGSLTETLSRIDLPWAQNQQAASVWQGIIAAHDHAYCLSQVAFDDITLQVPFIDSETGSKVRLQILARDVSITLGAAPATSILNVLPARISAIKDDQAGQTWVQLHIGKQSLLAHITRKSAMLLGLSVGMAVYVQIKGTSILN